MFTGIIAEQGRVVSLENSDDATGILIFDAATAAGDLAPGGSISVNGVCLSATRIEGHRISVDVMGETLERTTTGALTAGAPINLERCVPAGGRLDGHVVQGHVDGVGEILLREDLGSWERVRISIPAALARYVAEKGSIAVDGVSLTLTAVSPADTTDAWFEVGLIPITLAETVLGHRSVGNRVNVEVDVLAKYAQRLLAFSGSGVPE